MERVKGKNVALRSGKLLRVHDHAAAYFWSWVLNKIIDGVFLSMHLYKKVFWIKRRLKAKVLSWPYDKMYDNDQS
jgi:hypothetical protein